MGCWLKIGIAIIVAGLALQYFLADVVNNSKSHGNVDHRFREIRTLFDTMLKTETEGLALAVYVKNELVVDLWGGYAEKGAWRDWEKDTMTCAYSSTKAVGAMIIAMLVSRGHLNYDELVTKYWPEFGQHNKQNVTVEWLIGHKAGLIAFHEDFPLSKGNDHRHISKLIEQMLQSEPLWPAGTASGYHALTFGYLLDQLVRRVDPQHRSIGQFYRDEIKAKSSSNDFFLGLPPAEDHRVARIAAGNGISEMLKMLIKDPRRAFMFLAGGKMLKQACSSPSFLSILEKENPFNNPRIRQHENVAALGIGTARGLASVANTVIQEKLISENVWKIIGHPNGRVTDIVLGMQGERGYGFMYQKHPSRKNEWILTHPGHGGQKLDIFPADQVVIVLLRNGLRMDATAFDSTAEIRRRIFQILAKT